MSRHTTDSRVARLRSLTLAKLWFGTPVKKLVGEIMALTLEPVVPTTHEELEPVYERAVQLAILSNTGLTYSECMEHCEDYEGRLDGGLDEKLLAAERLGRKFGREFRLLDRELHDLCARPDAPDRIRKESDGIHKLYRWHSDVLRGKCVF